MAERRHPLDHLAGGLVRERHEQDLIRGEPRRFRSRTPPAG
jgi:hypothetical protein